jgi:hypothetical protein
MRSNNCPKCQGSMSIGFSSVTTDGWPKIVDWAEGAPVRSIWGNLKLGKRAKHEVETWRCARCGFLESYAKG